MAFTFAYRSPYDNLTGRFVRRFPDHTILSWFQEHWGTSTASEQLLGRCVYGFDSLFDQVREKQIPMPTSVDELGVVLVENIYAESGTGFANHILEVVTDDDELDLRYFFVEDEFADRHADLVAFLLHEGALPTEAAKSETDPCTYLYVHSPEQSADSQTWDRVVCPGVRISDGPGKVAEAYKEIEIAEAEEFKNAMVAQQGQGLSWVELLEAWSRSDAEADESKIISSDHICQLHHHAETWELAGKTRNLFYQVIVFDDYWAAAYPELAKSLDFYASDKRLIAT